MTRQDPRDPRAGSRSGSSRSGGRTGGPSTPREPTGRSLGPSSLWDDEQPRATPQPLRASWEPLPAEPAVPRERSARTTKRRSAFGWFVHRYGWRVYAIPVLLALTVVVILQIVRPAVASRAAAASAAPAVSVVTLPMVVGGVSTTVTMTQPVVATTTVKPPPATTTVVSTSSSGQSAQDPNTSWAAQLAAGALPPGGAFTVRGKGTWHVVKGTSKRVGTGPKLLRYTIEVEDGVTIDDQAFALSVSSVLADPRSWIGGDTVSLQRIDKGAPNFRISLTSQMTVRDPGYCGFEIPLEASCYNGAVGRVLINDARWERGAVSFNGDLGLYRVYAINHEVGHALDFHHQPCAIDGGLAPIMMQQSFSTANDDLVPLDPAIPLDGKVCRVNPYPFPMGGDAAASSGASTPAG